MVLWVWLWGTFQASKRIGEARGLFQQGRRDEGRAKAREIVEKYYASSS